MLPRTSGEPITRRGLLRGALGITGMTVALPLLVACGSSEPAAKPASPAAPQPTEAPKSAAAIAGPTAQPVAASGKEVELRLHYRQDDEVVYKERLATFTAQNPSIKVKPEPIPGASNEFYPKFQTMVAGGTVGDLYWSSIGIGLYFYLCNRKVNLPIDDLIGREKLDLNQYLKQPLNDIKFEGKLYGLPLLCHPSGCGLFFNEDIFAKAGVKPPTNEWTLDNLVDAGKQLTKDGNFGFAPQFMWNFSPCWMRTFGGEMLDKEGKKAVFNGPEGMKAFTWLSDIYHKHKITPKPNQITDSAVNMFIAGKIAMYQEGYWGIQMRQKIGDRFKMGGVKMPKGPTGVTGTHSNVDPLCISAKSKVPEEAFKFVVFMTSKDSGIKYTQRGTPGARQDVWEDSSLTSEPIHNTFWALEQNVLPLVVPYNFQNTQLNTVLTNSFQPLWAGDAEPTQQFLDKVASEVQDTLDKPRA